MPRPGFAPFREPERLAECESGSSRLAAAPGGLRQDLKHLIGRAAQARAFGRHHDGALDQNGVRDHEIDKLVIGPFRIAKAEFLVRRALLRSSSRGADDHRGEQLFQALAAWRRLEIFDNFGL